MRIKCINDKDDEIHQTAKLIRVSTDRFISFNQTPAMDVDSSNSAIEKKSVGPKVDFDSKNELNREILTPLHAAAQKGDIETFSFLIKQQQEPLPKEFFLQNSDILHCAVKADQLWFIQWLAREHMEFMISCENILAAIELAKSLKKDFIASFLQSFLGSKEWCNFLILQGLYDKPMSNGFYPIHVFSQFGCFNSVELLLNSKIPVDLLSCNVVLKYTPLDLAVEHGNMNIVRILVERGANLARLNGLGLHPIHVAANCGHIEIVSFLLSKKIAVNLLSETLLRSTIMDEAIWGGHLNIVKLLHQHKAGINKPNGIGIYPVHTAAAFNRPDILSWLLEQEGVSPDQVTDSKNAETPLLLALEKGYWQIVEALTPKAKYTKPSELKWPTLNAGAAQPVVLGDSKAMVVGSDDEKTSLPKHGTVEQRLLMAAARDAKALPILKNLLDHGVNVDTYLHVSVDGKDPIIPAKSFTYLVTALHEAVRHNNIEGVRFLLEKNANLYVKKGDKRFFCGIFPLAIASGNVELFQLLFSHLSIVPQINLVTLNDRAPFLREICDPSFRSIFTKSFSREIFFVMRQLLTTDELINFCNFYLNNFFRCTDRSLNGRPLMDMRDKFLDLMKQDTKLYMGVVNEQCKFERCNYSMQMNLVNILLTKILEEENFFPLFSENNYALLIKVVRFCKDNDKIIKLLTRLSLNKDLKILHGLLCQARGKGASAILNYVSESQRKELLSYNNFSVIHHVIKEGAVKTFFYFLKELNDAKLVKHFIHQYLKFGINSILTNKKHFDSQINERLNCFMNEITPDERNKILFEIVPQHLNSIRQFTLDYLLMKVSSDKRRNFILSLAGQIKLSWEESVFSIKLNGGTPLRQKILRFGVEGNIDVLLSRLDTQEDRELFLSLIPKSKDSKENELFDEYLKRKLKLIRAAAVNKLYKFYGSGFNQDKCGIYKAKLLYNLMLASKNRSFPRLSDDLYLHVTTFLTGLPSNINKIVIQAMQIKAINEAKAHGIILKEVLERANIETMSCKIDLFSTVFFQRMALCISDASETGNSISSQL